jgi:FkbM family methyltransferase
MKYYGQFDPPVDKFLHERYFFQSGKPGTLIECGAFDGVYESSCNFFEETLHWRAINIEPDPEIFASLSSKRPKATNLQLALSNKNDMATYTHVNYPGYDLCTNGSLQHLPTHKEALDSSGCDYKEYQVETKTYRDLIDSLNIENIDLMVLDVEGHELSVIDGMVGARCLPRILCVEHGHLGSKVLNRKLRAIGYVFDTISHVNSFYVHRSSISPTWKRKLPLRWIKPKFVYE